MTISQQMKTLKAPLVEWARGQRGKVEIVPDKLRVLGAVLSQSPGAPVAYLVFNAELPVSESGSRGEEGRVERSFLLVVSCGRSMKLEADASLVGVSNEKSTLDFIEEAREVLRKTEFPAENDLDPLPEYKGIQPFQVDGYLVDAWQIEISIGAQLPVYEVVNE